MGRLTFRPAGPDATGSDRGAILVPTLALTVVLTVIVMAIAAYAATGLRTSRVATEHTERNAAASAVLYWAVEELSAKRLYPSDCDGGDLAVPSGVVPAGTTVSLACTETAPVNANPAVHLRAVATIDGGSKRAVETVVQVPDASYDAVIAEWSAIGPTSMSSAPPTTTLVP